VAGPPRLRHSPGIVTEDEAPGGPTGTGRLKGRGRTDIAGVVRPINAPHVIAADLIPEVPPAIRGVGNKTKPRGASPGRPRKDDSAEVSKMV